MSKSRGEEQGYQIRDHLHAVALQTFDPEKVAGVARAWDVIMDRIRIVRGKPLPGNLKPELAKPVKARPAVYSEPIATPSLMLNESPAEPPIVDQTTTSEPTSS